VGSAYCSGEGTDADSGTPWPGLVPQVTNGESVVASIVTTLSKLASSSVTRVLQWATAVVQSTPCGACYRPSR
jgi:hypothetical protein